MKKRLKAATGDSDEYSNLKQRTAGNLLPPKKEPCRAAFLGPPSVHAYGEFHVSIDNISRATSP